MRRQRSKSWQQARGYTGAHKWSPKKRRRRPSLAGQVVVLSGLMGIAAWSYAPQLTSAWTETTTPPVTLKASERSAYYPNCAAARAAGVAPIQRGQPGYRDELDADGDGVACEPYRGF
jgi:hypothetical protein